MALRSTDEAIRCKQSQDCLQSLRLNHYRNDRMAGKKRQAFAYFRTSSAANVGADKDSERRQREAVNAYAKIAGVEVVAEFYDAAVSGADPIDARAGFVQLLEHCQEHGVGLVLVENAGRFARDLAVQLAGHQLLRERGIELVPADAPS